MKILSFNNKTKNLNDLTYTLYYNKLKSLVLSKFEYQGLEDLDLKEEYIEKILFEKGYGMVFDAKESIGLMVAKATQGQLNHFDMPTTLRPVATGYTAIKEYQVFGPNKDCVLIKNNDLMTPSEYEVQLFAWRLTNITRSQDININAHKTPVLILCDQKQMLTLKNVYKQYDGNEPVIFGDKRNNSIGGLTAIKTDAPIVFDKLQLQKHQVMNEFLTMFGINNANMDKKERLVDDEVQANNQEIQSFSALMLKARKQAISEINELFGTNIQVRERVLNLADFGLDSKGNLTGSEEGSEEVS